MTHIIHTIVVLAVFAVAGLPEQAIAQGKFNPFPIKLEPFKPVPKEVLTAWKDAGTEFGWLSGLYLPKLLYRPDAPNKGAFAAPTFRVIRWPDNVAKLPDPGVPFGLYLTNTRVTDENLKELAHLKSLHVLSLMYTGLTDKGMKELVVFQNLHVLDLLETHIGDYGMKHIAQITSLRALRPSEQITGEGLKEVGKLKNLWGLELYQVRKISGAGLKGLAGLKLKWLSLPPEAKTDIGLKHYLSAVETPTQLNLTTWNITDTGLKELHGQTSLKSLTLRAVKVSDAAVAELRDALPGCKIIR